MRRHKLLKVMKEVQKNDASMHNGLPSAEETKRDDQCCGIHGAARKRKGVKKATSSARRRNDKNIIAASVIDED